MNMYTIDLSHNVNGMTISITGIEANSGEQAAKKALNLIQGGDYFWNVVGIDRLTDNL